MSDGTPILRADSTDDDLQLEDEPSESALNPDDAGQDDAESDTVVKRQVPIVVNGVLHGYQEVAE